MPTPFIGKLSLLHQRVDFDAKTFTSSVDIVLPKSDKIGQQCTPKCSFYGVYPRFCVGSVNFGFQQKTGFKNRSTKADRFDDPCGVTRGLNNDELMMFKLIIN
jgi:hypothetical protein